jgi:copper chaperone CopZ
MKKIIILALALLTVAGASAQKTEKATKKIVTTVFITDIDCEGCTKKIYDNFYGKGVRSVKCDVATKSVAVTYDASKNTPEGLKPSFADLKVKVVKHMTTEEFEHYKQHHSHQGHGHSHHGHKH